VKTVREPENQRNLYAELKSAADNRRPRDDHRKI